MAELFADLPEALDNTIEIAKRCAFRPKGRKPILPRFVAGDDVVSETEQARRETAELRRQAEQGLRERLATASLAPGFTVADYEKRLAYEIDVIARMKFPGYFLIVADFINWAKAHGIPVGPGRGSGAGSLVAYALSITDLDPLRYKLLFERFLNPERVSMPDFDIDFCQDRRDEVIGYVHEQVRHTTAWRRSSPSARCRRARSCATSGRVLQMPFGQVDRLCKLVPNNPANPVTLAEAIEVEPRLQEALDGTTPWSRACSRSRRARGPAPPRRHARRRRGDRRPAAEELVPLYPRSAGELARHPVRHGRRSRSLGS